MKFELDISSRELSKYEDILKKYKFIRKTEGYGFGTVEISNLEELLNFKKDVGREVIVTDNGCDKVMLEIYDYYRE